MDDARREIRMYFHGPAKAGGGQKSFVAVSKDGLRFQASDQVLGQFYCLGANPIEQLIHRCGLWGLIFLLVTLSMTPLRMLTGQNWLIRLRRMFGLFAFFYICLHFLVYSGLDQRFDLAAIGEDIVKRPYITLGITGLVLLIPLALTSTAAMMRRLGPRWLQLHRLVYIIAVLGVWHFYWQVKRDTLESTLYALVLAVLLGVRVYDAQMPRLRQRARNG